MVMVGHETVGVAQPIITFVNTLQDIKEILSVLVVFENSFLVVAARGNMIHCTRIFYSKRTGHVVKILYPRQNVNTKDLTPTSLVGRSVGHLGIDAGRVIGGGKDETAGAGD
jgi:hypothetical protein